MLQMSLGSTLLSTDEVVSVWLFAACITEVGKLAHGHLFLSWVCLKKQNEGCRKKLGMKVN